MQSLPLHPCVPALTFPTVGWLIRGLDPQSLTIQNQTCNFDHPQLRLLNCVTHICLHIAPRLGCILGLSHPLTSADYLGNGFRIHLCSAQTAAAYVSSLSQTLPCKSLQYYSPSLIFLKLHPPSTLWPKQYFASSSLSVVSLFTGGCGSRICGLIFAIWGTLFKMLCVQSKAILLSFIETQSLYNIWQPSLI